MPCETVFRNRRNGNLRMLLEFRDSTIQFELNGIIVSMIGVRFDAIWFALTSEISGKSKNYTGIST